jgi:hypothetical protein
VEGVAAYHNIASGTGTRISSAPCPDQDVERFLLYQCDIALSSVSIATATHIKTVTDNTTSGHQMGV